MGRSVTSDVSPVAQPRAFARKIGRWVRNPTILQNLAGIALFFLVWQIARALGFLAVIPSPIEVAEGLPKQISQEGYWSNWIDSAQRVFLGFGAAALLAIPLGIWMGMSRRFRDFTFPIFEILRPIPPLAWLPLAILFWPSSEMTMVFLTFMGAFFPIFINVLAGIDSIDDRYVQAALSLGADRRTLFWRVLVPGTLPALFTGLSIAIAITWEVVIAAEMASGSYGLGYLTWNAYMSHSLVGIVIGMLSIGLAGLMSSVAMSWIGRHAAPWEKRR